MVFRLRPTSIRMGPIRGKIAQPKSNRIGIAASLKHSFLMFGKATTAVKADMSKDIAAVVKANDA